MKYWVYKGPRLIGGINVSREIADRIHASGVFRLVAVSGVIHLD